MATFEITVDDELITPEVTDFIAISEQCIQLYAKKNHDYGDSFNKGMKDIGLAYGVGRLYDKTNRIVNLLKTDNKCDESITDTLMDTSCYSIMILANINKEKLNNLSNIELK